MPRGRIEGEGVDQANSSLALVEGDLTNINDVSIYPAFDDDTLR
jgi:hypothetical protein